MDAPFQNTQKSTATLYFDSIDGFGEWKIHITSRAEKHLRECRKEDAKLLKLVLKKLRDLSNGIFLEENQRRLDEPRSQGVPVYEAKVTRDTRLVYQVDCVQGYEAEFECQIIKIFGFYQVSKVDSRFWEHMSLQLAARGEEYLRRCEFRNAPSENGGVSPASFIAQEEVEAVARMIPQVPKEDLQEIHALLVLEKSVSLSRELVNSVIANFEVALPFDLTPHEQKIVKHKGSCYVIGRSGTGKTTTMLFKMMELEREYRLNPDFYSKPRQMFVTRSKVLADKVQEFFNIRLQALENASKSREDMAATLQQRLEKHAPRPMVDQDQEEERSSTLPEKFSQLCDEHFPLFVTLDQLYMLLQGDLPLLFTRFNGRPLMEYKDFFRDYWSQFPFQLIRGLDPYLVYSELLGIIKGSEDSLRFSEGCLDSPSYATMSSRQAPAFSQQRDCIYNIFKLFLKKRRVIGGHDIGDRAHATLKALDKDGGLEKIGQRLDYLYVDEAQDNLLVDMLVLRLLCKNRNGLFIAGDTAQTISAGSAFRFNDLKAMLYRAEQKAFTNTTVARTQPKIFHLSVNYRSHSGIVNAARTVVDLITTFFPFSIDVLAPEAGVVAGILPTFSSGKALSAKLAKLR